MTTNYLSPSKSKSQCRKYLFLNLVSKILKFLQVEVIGGSDKYMATCRKCFFANVTIPASPRIPLKNIETVQNGENQEPAHKRALFEVEKNPVAVALN